ncbi:MAG: type II toxin-antitoxin system Phd/YefM family antitoxin [Candidatus Electrothrix aestuarii]|uniref:Antitoxin n=1 Tax=Candidatus Electrothrix aestuarii TaxID=3062594 RepID=A0AAU8LZ04_9BACT|nr:type II toxin-antitoxin system Phd/YefM family antitoxin [Candidatus Electrothrix aestuarii]
MDRIIDVTTARRQFGTLLDEVFHKGDTVIIERKGKPLARIVPIEEVDKQGEQISSRQRALLEKLHSLPALEISQDPVAVLRNMREQKRIKAGEKYGE